MQTRNQLVRSNSSYAYAFDTISVQASFPPLAFDLPHSHIRSLLLWATCRRFR